MKVRTGFVSNSSSSSFMIGIGVVTDWKKFNKWKEGVSGEWDVYVYNPEDELKKEYSDIEYHAESGRYAALASTNSPTYVYLKKEDYYKAQIKPSDDIKAKNLLTGKGHKDLVVYSVANDEGDSAFSQSDGWDMDYDIDLDWFNKEQQESYNSFGEKSGISYADKIFGAGRNG